MLHWETKFQAAFDALCAAFWTRIESRQQQRTFTAAVPTEAASSAKTACLTPGLRAKRSKHPTQPAPVLNPARRAPARRNPARWRPHRPHLPACSSSTQALQHSTEPRRHSLTAMRRRAMRLQPGEHVTGRLMRSPQQKPKIPTAH
ncbi:Hypothetical predicted protein [Pelobates cultripes]|uniref:Uncharacterized protein n=1 Tax=Pelobates cultripes TaxID=61616 RepID=A0AAD1VSR7_PELCU|nr:Hypothetical predicted protein [Pelobates cultripes]